MVRRIDPRYSNTLLDANALDKTGGPQDAAIDAIMQLDDVSIMLPHSVMAELEHPHTPAAVIRRARELIFTQPVSLTAGERAMHARIRDLLSGNAKPGKHDSDAYHLVESHKYGAGFFITNDARMLAKREEIAKILQLEIVSATEFLDHYRRCRLSD